MQALGVTVEAAQHILQQAKAHNPTFIAQGSLKKLVAERPSLPVQWPKLIHRFPLLQNTYAVSTAKWCQWPLQLLQCPEQWAEVPLSATASQRQACATCWHGVQACDHAGPAAYPAAGLAPHPVSTVPCDIVWSASDKQRVGI